MKIMLAVDGSHFSDAAVQALIARPLPKNTEIRVLHVLEPPSWLASRNRPGYAPALDAEWWAAEKEQAQRLVEDTAELLRSKGLTATSVVEEGDPKSRILDIAGDWNADLIILGSHGRTGLRHFLMGSVSEAVARHARCSVEIVRIQSRDRGERACSPQLRSGRP